MHFVAPPSPVALLKLIPLAIPLERDSSFVTPRPMASGYNGR